MSKKAEWFYNKFSFFYPLVDVFLRKQKTVLFNAINELPEGHLLEIGIGNGSHLQLYKRHKITGIDISAEMLEIARKRNCTNIELLQMDGEELLFGNEQFDYVVLSHVVAVVDNYEQLFQEVLRVLKPNGLVIILNHFTPENWLRHIDRGFGRMARMLHFKSVFTVDEISMISRFTLLKEVCIGSASYFKLLIYRKR